jgi:hypothetical protein
MVSLGPERTDRVGLLERQKKSMTPNGNQLAVATPQVPATRIVASGNRGLILNDMDAMWKFAGAVMRSGIAPRGLKTQEQIMVALQYGAELGLRPMQAMSTVMVVNGRASLYGDGMLAVAQASGFLVDIKETLSGTPEKPDSLEAVCEVKRQGRPTPARGTFSWKDAQRAGLASKDTYKQYPQRMLKARARAFALHDAFADILCGVLSAEEAGDIPLDGAAPVFVDGATQPPTDLESLIATDGEIVGEVVMGADPFGGDETPNEPAKVASRIMELSRAMSPADVDGWLLLVRKAVWCASDLKELEDAANDHLAFLASVPTDA